MKLSDEYGQYVDFDISEEYKKVAVSCSGGADSSILLYIVVKYLKDNNRNDTTVSVLTCANDFKHRWNARKAADVINYIIDKLEWNQFDTHYTYYRDFQDFKYFQEVENKLFIDNRIDLVIRGLTCNPKQSGPIFIENFENQMIDITSTGLDIRNNIDANNFKKNSTGSWYAPFVNVDKRFIKSMYEQNNVMDLFNMTRSCEAVPGKLYDIEFENTPCGTCWWCLERKWAFGEF